MPTDTFVVAMVTVVSMATGCQGGNVPDEEKDSPEQTRAVYLVSPHLRLPGNEANPPVNPPGVAPHRYPTIKTPCGVMPASRMK